VVFGGGITRRLHDTCQLAQAQYGIITSLPLEAQAVAPSEEEQLRFSLRNARNRAMYEEEIAALVQKNRSLETLYQQEMGKVHARTYSPHLRDISLSGVWLPSWGFLPKLPHVMLGMRGVISSTGSSQVKLENEYGATRT
jgi:hypothetical protein